MHLSESVLFRFVFAVLSFCLFMGIIAIVIPYLDETMIIQFAREIDIKQNYTNNL